MDRLAVEEHLMTMAEIGAISYQDLIEQLMKCVSDEELSQMYYDGFIGCDPEPLGEPDWER
tara:strand:- start:27 stop:209 length:183 start_codon:yes stop_codon:yes gene_type:complete